MTSSGISGHIQLSNGSSGFTSSNTFNYNGSDLIIYDATNDSNPSLNIGSSATDKLQITSNYNTGAQTLANVEFKTFTSSSTANDGQFIFTVDETEVMRIRDSVIGINTSTPSVNCMMEINGNLPIILPRKANPDPTGETGMIYYNTTINKLKFYDSTTWLTIENSSSTSNGVATKLQISDGSGGFTSGNIGFTIASDILDISTADGKYYINGVNVLNSSTLGSGITSSSLTNVGALISGSIASGFGTISTSNTITTTNNIYAAGIYTNGLCIQTSHKTYAAEITDNQADWVAIDSNTSTGIVASLTPKSTNSRLLIRCHLHIGADETDDARWYGIRLYRKIGAGAWANITGSNGDDLGSATGTICWIVHTWGAGITGSASYDNTIANLSGEYLDTPSDATSIHYYTVYWKSRLGETAINSTKYLNRADSSADAYRALPSSSITIQEIYYT